MLWWLKKKFIGKMKDKTGEFAIDEFVELKPRMYSFLVDDNNEHKKQKGWIEMLLEQLLTTNIKIIVE